MIRMIFSLLVLCVPLTPAFAQLQGGGKEPIEITADKTLEWHRAELQYVANGNTMVKQGTTTIKADRIAADYRDGAQTGIEIYRLTATGNVSIDDRGNTATGDRLVYEVDSGVATLTGQQLTMTSPEQTVTARDMFEYTVAAGKVRAIGDAKVVHGGDTLYADTLTAFLVQDQQGRNALDRVEGDGNVRIVTPTETLTGNRGLYRAADNTAIVTGAVKITRGQNVLTGERAEIDLTTSISRLFGSSIEDGQTGGRVRGVFYPESKGGNQSSPAPAAPAAPAPAPLLMPEPAEAPQAILIPEPIPRPTPKPQPPEPVVIARPDVAPATQPRQPAASIVPAPNSISKPLEKEAPPLPPAAPLDDLAQ